MAQVNDDDIKKLQFSKDGSPWVNVAAKSSIDLDTLTYSLDGSPWWGIEVTGMTTTTTTSFISSNIKKFIGVAYSNLKKVMGVSITNIKKLEGIE